MLKTVKLLIVDLDGTLADTKQDIAFSLNSTLARFSLPPFAEERIAEHVGTGIMPLIEERVPAAEIGEFTVHFEETYLQNIASCTRLFPGWEEILPLLNQLQLIILTSKIQKFTDALVPALQLDRYFLAAYGREAFPERKPSAVPVLAILEKFRRSPNEALMIGDMPADILSGQAARTFTCAALFGYGKPESLLALSPTCTLQHPGELVDLLGLRGAA